MTISYKLFRFEFIIYVNGTITCCHGDKQLCIILNVLTSTMIYMLSVCEEEFEDTKGVNDLLVLRELLDEFFSFMCMLCRSLFVLLSFLFFPLCCLSFIDLWILITPLVSSNSSSHTLSIYIIGIIMKNVCCGLNCRLEYLDKMMIRIR
jgi:hypothetical protein